MPLAVMDPVTAAHLAAIGLPYGPNTNPGLVNPASGPGGPTSASYTALNTSTQLGASPALNGATQSGQASPQAAAQQENQQASQQDTQAIFAGGQAARLAQAQQAQQPAANSMGEASMPLPADAVPTAEQAKAATPGLGAIGASIAPALAQSDVSRRLAEAQAAAAPAVPPQGDVGQAASDSAASGPSPQVAPGGPSGAPQAPPVPTPAAAPQTPPVASPAPAQGPVATPPAPVAAPKGPVSPEDIAQAIYGQESGYGRNTKTSPTGAVGGMQIEPGTWKQYAQPGEDINNPTDNRNVGNRIVQDLYQKAGGDPARVAVGYFSGPGNIAPPGSPTPWLTDKSDGHTSVSQYVSSVMSKLGQPGQFTAASTSERVGPNSQPGEYSAIDAIHQGSAIGIDPKAMMDLATSLGYKPVDTQAFNNRNLVAMGMAMMGGRTFADSMKNGAGVMNDSNNAMLGLQEKQNSNALQMAQVGINAKRADAQMALEAQRVKAMDRERPIGTSQSPDGTMMTTMYNPVDGSTRTVQQGGANAGAISGFRKENEKDVDALEGEGKAAAAHIQETHDLMTMLNDPNTHAGPGLVQAIQRHVAAVSGDVANNIGLPSTATNDQIAERLSKMTQSEAAQAMRGTGLRNALEFKTFTGQAVDLNTTPDAARAILQPSLTRAQNAYKAYNDWVNLGLPGQNALRNQQGAVGAFKQKYDLNTANTLVAGSGGGQAGMAKGTGDAVAAAKQTANGGLQGTTPNGVSFTLHP